MPQAPRGAMLAANGGRAVRTIVITYCLLTLAFAGGCAVVLMGLRSGPGVPPAEVLAATAPVLALLGLSVLGNLAFLWMASGKTPGRLLVWTGGVYGLVQQALAQWLLGPNILLAVLLLPVLGGKGGAVAVLGRMRERGMEDKTVLELAQAEARGDFAKKDGRDAPGHDDQEMK